MSMPAATSANTSVLVQLREQLFAFPVNSVFEMVSLSDCSKVPGTPDYVRGVINLRGRILPLVDLRMRLGMPTAHQELETLLAIFDAREQDHRRWIAELEACLAEDRPFTLATDPHKCAFGRWYDSLKTEDITLAAQLKKIDGPHQRIHRKGGEALAAHARGHRGDAVRIAEEIRTVDLSETLRLFEETRRVLRDAQREIAVVVSVGAQRVAVVVDRVIAVEALMDVNGDHGDSGALPTADPAISLVVAIATRARDQHLVLRLATQPLLDADVSARLAIAS